MTLEILTPDKQVYEGEANSVTLPGTLGQFELLNHHAPIISTLEVGKVIIRNGTKEDVYFIEGGVVECLKDKVTVLVEGIRHK
jgi:F-type H+-transporting ATPase subunit epsilon